MMVGGEIVNRVAKSGLVVFALEDCLPKGEVRLLDLAPGLREGFVLEEKPFRTWARALPAGDYKGQVVALHCSTDAIVPPWGFMLVAATLAPYTKDVFVGDAEQARTQYALARLAETDWSAYTDKKVMLKGCANLPQALYTEATNQLIPRVQNLMFGEACAAVPVFKRK